MQKDVLDEKLYTSTEVAEILGVSLRSIYRYMEEGKLKASVRTATGRHRFTRKDINDFLQPSGAQGYPQQPDITAEAEDEIEDKYVESRDFSAQSGFPGSVGVGAGVAAGVGAKFAEPTATKKDLREGEQIPEYEPEYEDVRLGDRKSVEHKEPEEFEEEFEKSEGKEKDKPESKEQERKREEEEEEIDWLERFRQAAERYRQASARQYGKEADREKEYESAGGVGLGRSTRVGYEDLELKSEEPKGPKVSEKNFHYYKSAIGGLKEIAQSLDKAAKNASLNYAFTMNAGLSLHKPIKPFSLIHAYVRPKDLSYFEKVLQLSPVDKEQAQLCLITSNEDSIYSQVVELHGLYAVSNDRLRADLIEEGEFELADEIE